MKHTSIHFSKAAYFTKFLVQEEQLTSREPLKGFKNYCRRLTNLSLLLVLIRIE